MNLEQPPKWEDRILTSENLENELDQLREEIKSFDRDKLVERMNHYQENIQYLHERPDSNPPSKDKIIEELNEKIKIVRKAIDQQS